MEKCRPRNIQDYYKVSCNTRKKGNAPKNTMIGVCQRDTGAN